MLETLDVLEEDEGANLDWQSFLIQLLVDHEQFQSVFSGLSQFVSTKPPPELPSGGGGAGAGAGADADAGADKRSETVPRGELCKVTLLKNLRRLVLAQDPADASKEVAATGFSLNAPTVKFLIERFRLLGYLAREQDWWRDEKNYCHAAALTLIIPLLADAALAGAELRAALGAQGAVEDAVELLGSMHKWNAIVGHQKDTGGAAKAKATAAAAAAAAKGGADGQAGGAAGEHTPGVATAYCVARDLVRLIGNACCEHRVNQDQVLELGGVQLILARFLHDGNNPYIREWAISAVSNLTQGNEAVQALIESIEKNPSGVVDSKQLEELGMEVKVDPVSGKLRAAKPGQAK